PTILRDARQYATETDAKYRMIRSLQAEQPKDISLMPNQQRPTLPDLDILGSVESSGESAGDQ
ncbi:MAG: hypothetical protein OEM03_07585, partial [Chromatiales bacterium]|nr:hypothetical protein [Chromatiales bacterium]